MTRVHTSRIFAVVVLVSLIMGSSVIFVFQPSNIQEGNTTDNDDHFIPNPQTNRPTRAGTPWPMFNKDVINTAYTPDIGPISDNILWYNQTGGITYGSPSIVNGKVFIGGGNASASQDYGFMNCYDAENGTLLWRFETYSPINPVNNKYGLTSTPAVDNGLVYFGGDRIYCLYENNGTVKWTVEPGNMNYGDGTPTIANSRLFMPGSDRKLYCIDPDTGVVLWTFQTQSGNSGNYGLYAAPAVVNDFVYLAACDRNLYQIDVIQPGEPGAVAIAVNTFTMAYASYVAPVVVNGRVFTGCGYSGLSANNRFYALNATDLSLIWEFYPGSDTSFFGSASFYNDVLYVPSRDGNLYALDAMSSGPTPTEYWRIGLSGSVWSTPAITNDRLYVGSQSNYLYCINLTQPATPFYYWRYNLVGDVDSSPAVVDGKVYVGTHGNGGRIYCFGSSVIDTVDSIVIRDAPGGGGQAIPPTRDVGVGTLITGYAAAYNDSQGYLYDIPVNWSVANSVGVNATTNPTLTSTFSDFYSGFFGGSSLWTANDGNGHLDSVDFTILPPQVGYIQIVDSEGFGLNEILGQTVDVGFSIQGWAASFNDTIGYLGDVSVNWSVSNGSGATAYTTPIQGTNSTFFANLTGGNATWIADDGAGHSDSVLFTIRDPTVDSLTIVDTPNTGSPAILGATVDVGYTVLGYAAGFNITAGYIGDISVDWKVINSSGATGFTSPTSGSSSTLNVSSKSGTVQWIADDGFGHWNYSTFIVNSPVLDFIIIRTGPNGTGSWVGDSTYVYGGSDTFYSAGYNDSVGWIGDVDAQWTSDAPSIGDVVFGPANSTTFTSLNNGTCTITATNNSVSNTTGMITIINYTVDSIIIRDSPGGAGTWIGDSNFDVGQTATFYAAAYNNSGGYLGDVAVDWDSSNATVATVTTPGVSTLLSVQFVSGTCNITATYGSTITNVTGTFTVISANLDYIVITDSENGNAISTLYLDVGGSSWIYASGYNNTGSTYVGLISVIWDQSPSTIGSFGSSPSTSTILTAGLLGGWTDITAFNSTWLVGDNFTLVVNDPTPDFILIRDSALDGGSEVASDSFTLGGTVTSIYYCAAYNVTAGYIQDVPAIWSVSGGIGDVNPNSGTSTEFTATTSGVGNLTATYSSLTYSTEITVNPAPDTTPPAAPTGLDVRKVIAGGALLLEWNANSESDLAGYNIYRTTTNGTGWVLVNTELVIEITYLDIGRENGTTYYYYITAVDDATVPNESPPSNTVNNTCDVDTDMDGEFNLEDFDDDNDGLTDLEESGIGTDPLSWDTDGDGYSDSVDFYPLDPTRWVEENLPPEAPTNVLVTAVTTGNILNISWDASSENDLAGYNLFRSLIQSSEFQQVNDDLITSEFYVDGSKVNGVTYYYYVVAVDTINQSSNNSEVASGMPDLDTDLDGLLNSVDPDDDNDNVTDVDEIAQGTDPLLKDTDADGYNDDVDYYPTDSERWEEPVAGGTTEGEDELPIFMILIPIIIIVLILLIILLTKKRKPKEAPPQVAAPKRTLPPPPPKQKTSAPPPKHKEEMPQPIEKAQPPQEDDDFDEDALPPPDDFDEDALPPPDD